MIKRLGKFEIPKRLIKDEDTATNTYAKYVAEPFEKGYAYTIGNGFRRVLLSSIEGLAIYSVKIEGVDHEFQSIPYVQEDMAEIVLNLKKVLLRSKGKDKGTLTIELNREGPVTAGDIQTGEGVEVVNPDQLICTLSKKHKFSAELNFKVGRGFSLADENKSRNQEIGIIFIDALYSPIKLVRYEVENTRVGMMTDYDKLTLEISTDGRVTPDLALKEASAVLTYHINVFHQISDIEIEFNTGEAEVSEEQNRLSRLLKMSVNEIELSVRAANCLNNANITTVGQLASKTEQDMLRYRNFGRKSLNEIKDRLEDFGLSLGANVDERLLDSDSEI